VLSSQIEGTQSSFSDLMLFESAEAPSVPLEDVQEVSNYVAAMNHGIRRLREDFPLSLRLIREIHKILLSKGRGSQRRPGEFRETQNRIGGTRPGNAAFVPPPPEKMMECVITPSPERRRLLAARMRRHPLRYAANARSGRVAV